MFRKIIVFLIVLFLVGIMRLRKWWGRRGRRVIIIDIFAFILEVLLLMFIEIIERLF